MRYFAVISARVRAGGPRPCEWHGRHLAPAPRHRLQRDGPRLLRCHAGARPRQGRQVDAQSASSLGDAEQTLEADASYDAVVNRHLVWTLVDPEAAFAEWFRILQPGWHAAHRRCRYADATDTTRRILACACQIHRADFTPPVTGPGIDRGITRSHRVAGVFFERRRADRIVRASAAAGFRDVVVDRDLRPFIVGKVATCRFASNSNGQARIATRSMPANREAPSGFRDFVQHRALNPSIEDMTRCRSYYLSKFDK